MKTVEAVTLAMRAEDMRHAPCSFHVCFPDPKCESQIRDFVFLSAIQAIGMLLGRRYCVRLFPVREYYETPNATSVIHSIKRGEVNFTDFTWLVDYERIQTLPGLISIPTVAYMGVLYKPSTVEPASGAGLGNVFSLRSVLFVLGFRGLGWVDELVGRHSSALRLQLRLLRRLLTNVLKGFIILSFFTTSADPMRNGDALPELLARRPDIKVFYTYSRLTALLRLCGNEPRLKGTVCQQIYQARHPRHFRFQRDTATSIAAMMRGERAVYIGSIGWLSNFEPIYQCHLHVTPLDMVSGYIGSYSNLRLPTPEMGDRKYTVWKAEKRRLKKRLWPSREDCSQPRRQFLALEQCTGVFSAIAILYAGFSALCALELVTCFAIRVILSRLRR